LSIYYITISILAFLAMGLDKSLARAHQWRIPERVLLSLAWLGGAFGALSGMLVFRHKTRKPHFWITVIASSLLHAALIYYFTIEYLEFINPGD
jgi:uncharacterized membrane protein YsdA (DUF1294 family)